VPTPCCQLPCVIPGVLSNVSHWLRVGPAVRWSPPGRDQGVQGGTGGAGGKPTAIGRDVVSLPNEDVRKMVTERTSLRLRSSDDRGGRNIILDGLKDDRWSILVGPDAERLDESMNWPANRRTALRISTSSKASRARSAGA